MRIALITPDARSPRALIDGLLAASPVLRRAVGVEIALSADGNVPSPMRQEACLLAQADGRRETVIGQGWLTEQLRHRMGVLPGDIIGLLLSLAEAPADPSSQTPTGEGPSRLIYPASWLRARLPTGRLGIILPLARQVPAWRVPRAWRVTFASPYAVGGLGEDRLAVAAADLRGADHIVLWDLAFDDAMALRVAALSGSPVWLARTELAALLDERLTLLLEPRPF